LLIAVASRPVKEFRRSKSVASSLATLGGSVWWRGTRISDVRLFNLKLDGNGGQELRKELSSIPYGFCLDVGGKTITPETMKDFGTIDRLESLVLHNTSVDEQSVVEFQQRRPDVDITIDLPGTNLHSHKTFPAHTQ